MRAAAKVIVGSRGETPIERQHLIEEAVTDAQRRGDSPKDLEDRADILAAKHAPALRQAIAAGHAAIWQDPGYIAWDDRRRHKETPQRAKAQEQDDPGQWTRKRPGNPATG